MRSHVDIHNEWGSVDMEISLHKFQDKSGNKLAIFQYTQVAPGKYPCPSSQVGSTNFP